MATMSSHTVRLYVGPEFSDFTYPEALKHFISYRYVLEAGLTRPTGDDPTHKKWHGELSWYIEVQHRDGQWRQGKSYYRCVGLRPDFDLGSSHIWYDGSHCALALGWLYFAWGAGGCELSREDNGIDRGKTWYKRVFGEVDDA
jgi:hypothetical protein